MQKSPFFKQIWEFGCLSDWLVDLVCALVGWLEGGLWLVDGHVGCWMSG